MKFGRTYNVVVQGRSRTWTFGYPITCNMRVSTDGTPTCNKAHFYFFNLPENMRNDITRDTFDNDLTIRSIIFAAGYTSDTQLPVLFAGSLFWAFSYRKGADWITEMECFDGGEAIQNGSIEATFSKDADSRQILRALVLAMPNVNPGSISTNVFKGERTRGLAISGNPWDELIRRILPENAQAFISNGVVHVIAQNEYLPLHGALGELSADTGMIGSPRRSDIMTTITLVFEPRMKIGQKVSVISSEPYAGDGKVMKIFHAGMISPSNCGELTTMVTLFRSPELVEVAA